MRIIRVVLACILMVLAGAVYAAPRGDAVSDLLSGDYRCNDAQTLNASVTVHMSTIVEPGFFESSNSAPAPGYCESHLEETALLIESSCVHDWSPAVPRDTVRFTCSGTREAMVGVLAELQKRLLQL